MGVYSQTPGTLANMAAFWVAYARWHTIPRCFHTMLLLISLQACVQLAGGGGLRACVRAMAPPPSTRPQRKRSHAHHMHQNITQHGSTRFLSLSRQCKPSQVSTAAHLPQVACVCMCMCGKIKCLKCLKCRPCSMPLCCGQFMTALATNGPAHTPRLQLYTHRALLHFCQCYLSTLPCPCCCCCCGAWTWTCSHAI